MNRVWHVYLFLHTFGVGISVNPDNTGAEIGFKPGLAIAIGEHLSFVTKYGFLGYRNDYLGSSVSGISLSLENLSLGFDSHIRYSSLFDNCRTLV